MELLRQIGVQTLSFSTRLRRGDPHGFAAVIRYRFRRRRRASIVSVVVSIMTAARNDPSPAIVVRHENQPVSPLDRIAGAARYAAVLKVRVTECGGHCRSGLEGAGEEGHVRSRTVETEVKARAGLPARVSLRVEVRRDHPCMSL
jgi:hypothetical protein